MGWQENIRKVFDFRLIEPDFDGDSELRRLLGIKSFVPRNDVSSQLNETKSLPLDQDTQKMIDYLMNGKKED